VTTAEARSEHGGHSESRRIHFAKTITWRIAATTTTVAIVFALTGDLEAGAAVGGIEAVAKLGLYYGHERIWSRALGTRGSPNAH
jgi:adenylylsulfate kinase